MLKFISLARFCWNIIEYIPLRNSGFQVVRFNWYIEKMGAPTFFRSPKTVLTLKLKKHGQMLCLEVLYQLSGRRCNIYYLMKSWQYIEVIFEMRNLPRSIALIHRNVTQQHALCASKALTFPCRLTFSWLYLHSVRSPLEVTSAFFRRCSVVPTWLWPLVAPLCRHPKTAPWCG